MRSLLPFLLVLACPLAMLLMGFVMRGRPGGSLSRMGGHDEAQAPSEQQKEIGRLRADVAALRSELDDARQREPRP